MAGMSMAINGKPPTKSRENLANFGERLLSGCHLRDHFLDFFLNLTPSITRASTMRDPAVTSRVVRVLRKLSSKITAAMNAMTHTVAIVVMIRLGEPKSAPGNSCQLSMCLQS